MSKSRCTTIESLEACLKLIDAKDKQEFAENYNIAVHENGGNTVWVDMYGTYIKKGRKHKVEKPKKEKVKKHWYTDGKINMCVPSCPVGFHKGKVGKFKNMYGDCWR